MRIYAYIFVMALIIYLIRVLPLTLIRKPIQNRFIKSFLFYVPYVTLAVMTFPAILDATGNVMFGGVALILGIIFVFKGAQLFTVASICCVSVLVLEIISYFLG